MIVSGVRSREVSCLGTTLGKSITGRENSLNSLGKVEEVIYKYFKENKNNKIIFY